jgi:FtsP/CotA-like multicopper oxidase with cupredoxin domain
MTQLLATLDSFAPGRASRPRTLLVPLLALLLLGGGVALALQTAARPQPRELTLVARGMAFYLPGDSTPNPRLVVESGEPVRLVLRNGDRGMAHDVAVPAGDGERARSREVRGAGETAELSFRAPETAGTYEYVCTLHSRMMRGVLEVR